MLIISSRIKISIRKKKVGLLSSIFLFLGRTDESFELIEAQSVFESSDKG